MAELRDRTYAEPPAWLIPLERDVLEILRSTDGWWRVAEIRAALVSREPYCATAADAPELVFDKRIVDACELLMRLGLVGESSAPWPPRAWIAEAQHG
jgi:hypothetical protein